MTKLRAEFFEKEPAAQLKAGWQVVNTETGRFLAFEGEGRATLSRKAADAEIAEYIEVIECMSSFSLQVMR
jgi:hypothetical protein